MSKKTKLILSAVFLLIISSVLLLQIDDDLEPEAQSMYEQAVAHKESEAYIYLMGILAAVDEKPEDVGESLLKSIREAEKKYFKSHRLNQDFDYDEYPHEKRLPLFELAPCEDDDCKHIDRLFTQKFDLDNLPKEQENLLKRYRRFIALKDYHTLAIPHLLSPLPPYQYVMKGNDLANLEAIHKARNGNIDAAKKRLLDDISSLRIQLQQADNLVAKMIYTIAISRNIDVLSVLIHKNNSPSKEKIKPLTPDEKSVVKAMNHEFGLSYNLYSSMDRSQDIFSKNGYTPGWITRMLFKPNMTINSSYPQLKQVGENSLLNPKEFVMTVASERPLVSKKTYIRNYLGTVLGQISTPNFSQNIAKLFYLDAKIHLFNETADKTELPSSVSHISNPFSDKKTAFYSEDKKAVCIDGPFPHKRKEVSCLRIK